MDQDRFNTLSRAVGQAKSRRAAIGAFVAVALGGVVPGIAAAAPGEEGSLIPGCRIVGQRCRKDSNCCTGKCKDDRCACINKGGSCLVEFAPGLMIPVHANCCTNRCSKSTNKCR